MNTEKEQKDDKQEGKLYKPEDVRNPYFIIPFYTILIIYAFDGIIEEIKLNNAHYILITIFLLGIIYLSYLIIGAFVFGVYGILKERSVIGKNIFKMKLGEILFEEIDEIHTLWKSYDIVIKNRKGKWIIINTSVQPTEEFFNTILAKAVNCRRIDIEYVRKSYPGLVVYKK